MSLFFAPVQAQLNTDRITAIGRNALYFEDYVLSIQYFNQVIRLKPYLAEPYFYRAIAKIQLEDYQGALLDCNAAIERNPFSPGCYYARGYVYRQLEQWVQADADYTEALHFSPENRTYMLLRADTRAQMGQYDEALEDIEWVLRREPQSASVWSEKGRVCFLQKDTLTALNAFEQAAAYDKTNPAVWSALGVTNLMLDREEEAYVQLTQAINLGSKWAGDYINRGLLHYRRHNYRGALSDYDQAVKIAPRDADCYYNRGIMRQEVGDYNNALEDLNTAIDLAPERTEMRYQRALVEMQLKQWSAVIVDLDSLIARYPYFLPAYYLAAQAQIRQGNQTAAFRYRQKAYELEQQKEQIQAQQAAMPNTDMQIADAQPQKKDHRKEFSSSAAQNQTEVQDEEQKYESQTRGTIQKRYQDVVNEPNIVLSYYSQDLSLRRTNYYHPLVEAINQSNILPATLRFTGQEIALTAEMVDFHFAEITRLSQYIDQHMDHTQADDNLLPYVFLSRAVEFAIVQDYSSAIDDCTRALQCPLADNRLHVIATFCRANWRYRLLEYQRATGEQDATANMDFDIMLRDYDQVIRIQPDFAFAIFNKANILCAQKQWNDAIDYYTQAIQLDGDFAEAWFNRGLTYVYIGENEKGLSDLSKAGELGIYQAYNLITRFK
ncbi:MAG: tetratricopeptide repeat protein [Paludibacteraceae bacterium]|nr:tetratricopeptide repeat protein [Paludibacteraceae bacterium]MBQ2190250.1 tetratricopeptide repeat protein [Paludibacteraceae bacterium]MBQ2520851.1 tetratricopeptide repeat protein [Paludibacteraceae bacterium]